MSSTLIYFKQPKDRTDWGIFGMAVLFATFIAVRANPFLVFLNICAVILANAYLIVRRPDSAFDTFIAVFTSPLESVFQTLKTKKMFQFHWNPKELTLPKTDKWNLKSGELFTSVFVTLGVIMVVIPLLASANPIFERRLTDLGTFVENIALLKFLPDFTFDTVLQVRIIIFGIVLYILPKLFTFLTTSKHSAMKTNASIQMLLPKIVLGIIIAFFFLTQIQLYMASPEMLQELRYTNSQQTREIFAQLSVVSFIIFALIYNDNSTRDWNRKTTLFLIIEALFLSAMAFKSDFDYSSDFGFTHRRLWGFVVVTWIASVFTLYLYHFYQQKSHSSLVRPILLLTSGLLIIVNILNFDHLIYHVRPPHLGDGVTDRTYFWKLSVDGGFYKEEIEYMQQKLDEDNFSTLGNYPYYPILSNSKEIQEQYKKDGYIDWRSFNLSYYQEYQRIKDINVQQIQDELSLRAQQHYEQEL